MKKFILALAALLLAGCAHRAPRAVTLPTTATLRAPLVAAQMHVARALAVGKREQTLAQRAVAVGLAAGSDEARELSTLTLAHAQADNAAQDQLTAALYQTGSLQRELDARQAQIDALARHDKAATAEANTLGGLLHRWKLIVLMLVVADYFAGAPIQRGLHAAVRWVASVAVTGFHVAIGLFLRCWPLLAAMF